MLGARSTPGTGPTTGVEIECSWPGGREQDRPDGDESLGTVAHEVRHPRTTNRFALAAIADGRDGDPATPRARMIVKRQARRAVPAGTRFRAGWGSDCRCRRVTATRSPSA